jgi:UDP-N-acetylglucosamine acyltransferase
MPTQIHPTAVIDPSAQIGAEVEIGPYCVIGANVAIGDGSWLQNHVTICGPTTIGKENRFYSFTSIGQRTQDLKYSSEPTYLEIGDRNSFREFCTVNRGTLPDTKTVVGNDNNFLAYCHIAHDCVVGNHCIFSNNGTLAGHIVVEDYVILGGLTAVHQFCRLGKHAITGGCSKIVQDVAPYTIADGNPARTRGINQIGLQRHGYSEEQIKALRAAYKTLFRGKMNVSQALDVLRGGTVTAEVQHLIDFAASSQRGLVMAGWAKE